MSAEFSLISMYFRLFPHISTYRGNIRLGVEREDTLGRAYSPERVRLDAWPVGPGWYGARRWRWGFGSAKPE